MAAIRARRRPRSSGAASCSAHERATVGSVARAEHVPRPDAGAFDAELQIGPEADCLAGTGASTAWRSPRPRPFRRHSAVVEPGSQTSSTSTLPSRQRTVRTSRWSASSSAGGRVWGVILSSCSWGPIVNASRTTIQPDGDFQVVTRTFVPGS